MIICINLELGIVCSVFGEVVREIWVNFTEECRKKIGNTIQIAKIFQKFKEKGVN